MKIDDLLIFLDNKYLLYLDKMNEIKDRLRR